MVKLILHNTFYELAYPNGIEITHKHEAGKYDFDKLANNAKKYYQEIMNKQQS